MRHQSPWESKNKKAIIEAKVDIVNVKEAVHVLEWPVSTNRLIVHRLVEDLNIVQDQLATMSAKCQIAEKALKAAFPQSKQYIKSCN